MQSDRLFQRCVPTNPYQGDQQFYDQRQSSLVQNVDSRHHYHIQYLSDRLSKRVFTLENRQV